MLKERERERGEEREREREREEREEMRERGEREREERERFQRLFLLMRGLACRVILHSTLGFGETGSRTSVDINITSEGKCKCKHA